MKPPPAQLICRVSLVFTLGPWACYYIFLLSGNGFISLVLSPAPSLPSLQIVFRPPLRHVSITQKVRLPAVIRLLLVLLSCRQPLSGRGEMVRKKKYIYKYIILALKTTDVLNMSEGSGQWPVSGCQIIIFQDALLNGCSGLNIITQKCHGCKVQPQYSARVNVFS